MNLEKNYKNNIIYLYVMSDESKEDLYEEDERYKDDYYPTDDYPLNDFDKRDKYDKKLNNNDFYVSEMFNNTSNYYYDDIIDDTSINDKNIHQCVRDYIYGYYKNLPKILIDETTSSPIPIGEWNVSQVTDMSYLFAGITRIYNVEKDEWEEFNENLNDWDVSNVNDMTAMFYYCKFFKSPLNNWEVSNVINMSYMFAYCKFFNSDINSWDVSNVTNMNNMFFNCLQFNKPLNNWNVSNCINFDEMFYDNDGSDMNFCQNLSNWRIKDDASMEDIFSSRMRREYYPMKFSEFIKREASEHFEPINYQITETLRGRAYEIHNEFKGLSEKKIKYLLDFISNEVNVPTNIYNINNINRHIVTKLSDFVNSDENVDLDKNVYISAIDEVGRRLDFRNASNLIQLCGYIIDFVFNQSYIFKMNYVQSYLKDCMGGYSTTDAPLTLPFNLSNVSCVGGIRERIILALGKTLEIICSTRDETICPQMYQEIYKNVFKPLVMNEIIEEWTNKYLDNEEFKRNHNIREHDLESKRKMKQSLTNFLKKRYSEAGELTSINSQKIEREVENFDTMGVFDNLYFGGKRRKIKYQTKKINKKYNKKSNKKYYKKSNKKSKKNKYHNKRKSKKYY